MTCCTPGFLDVNRNKNTTTCIEKIVLAQEIVNLSPCRMVLPPGYVFISATKAQPELYSTLALPKIALYELNRIYTISKLR